MTNYREFLRRGERFVAMLLVMSMMLACFPGVVRGESDKPSRIEVLRLPKFCWSMLDGMSRPEYGIDRASCGYGMGHYCFGLMYLQRAKKSFGNKKAKIGNLVHARIDVRYTTNAFKEYPGCYIRKHVENTLSEIEGMLLGLGVK